MSEVTECWLFMSYAWDDIPDDDPEHSNVSAFYKCVREALAPKITDGFSGFLDRHALTAGQSWKEQLVAALRGARGFVPLLTRRYFTRDACGREWAGFQKRVEASPAAKALIHPIVWDKPQRIAKHPQVGSLQLIFPESAFASPSDLRYRELYAKLGMSALVQRMESDSEAETTVQVIVDVLTDLIVDRWEAAGLQPASPALVPAWDDMPPTFGVSAEAPSEASFPCVHFAVAAGTATEMHKIRANAIRHYPGAARDWIPYETPGTSASQIALEAALSFQLRCEWLAVQDTLVSDIRRIEKNGAEPVILLVDPWSLKVSALEKSLRAYDENRFKNCVVIVAWNEAGAVNAGVGPTDLEKVVQQVFERNLPFSANSKVFNTNVKDFATFREAVLRAVQDMRSLAALDRSAQRPVQSSEPPPLVRNQ